MRALLEAARAALAQGAQPVASGEVALELVLAGPEQAPSDATNYLEGIGDVLEDKQRRGALIAHLGPLADVWLVLSATTTRSAS